MHLQSDCIARALVILLQGTSLIQSIIYGMAWPGINQGFGLAWVGS